MRWFLNDLLAAFSPYVNTKQNKTRTKSIYPYRLRCSWNMNNEIHVLSWIFFLCRRISTFYAFIHTLFTAQHAPIYMCILNSHWRLWLPFNQTDYAYLNGFNRYDFQLKQKKNTVQVMLFTPRGSPPKIAFFTIVLKLRETLCK